MPRPTLIQRMAFDLGVPGPVLRRLARSAPHRYKVYTIPKRSGSGIRVIAQPAKEVKAVQRWLVANEFSLLPRHDAATAYAEGSSILTNAQRHLAGRFLLKMDFAEFFPSIKEADLTAHIAKHLPDRYTEAELGLICRFSLWYPPGSHLLELCIGAPSSPILSNTVMHDFDVALSAYCALHGIVYTRYADDLAFSTSLPDCLARVPGIVRDVLTRAPYPTLRVNERKTVFTSKKFMRSVTGLVISSQGKLSLGRDRKRLIRAMLHWFVTGKLSTSESAKLKGLLAFAEGTEPDFVRRLERHYSKASLDELRRFQLPPEAD
jgi:RNA-directed DNA polymerase